MNRGMIPRVYYFVKPLIPRGVQIALRRNWVRYGLQAACRRDWPIDPGAGEKPPGWEGWPEGKRFAVVLTHDVETGRGVQRCLPLVEAERSRGFLSSFNFVAERYTIPAGLRDALTAEGFEVGLHGLHHDGKMYLSRRVFVKRAERINRYLREWQAVGFRSPAMHHDLKWLHALDIEYDSSTFDVDPFEPQPDGMRSIFPLWITDGFGVRGYLELPYTLPQDLTVFVLFGEKGPRIWKEKLAWIAERGGMALMITHPDYMFFGSGRRRVDEYPVEYYVEFLEHLKDVYGGLYWQALPREVARFAGRRLAATTGGDTDPASPRTWQAAR